MIPNLALYEWKNLMTMRDEKSLTVYIEGVRYLVGPNYIHRAIIHSEETNEISYDELFENLCR